MATPNMGLTEPGVLTTPGPTYATQVNSDLDILDAHNHTSGKGALIPTAALNINADLPFGSNNATGVRAVRLSSGSSVVGADLRTLISIGGELYYVDASGNQVQVSSSGALNIGTFAQTATPANPASGFNKLYPKSDNNFYFLTSGGTEKQLLTASGTVTVNSYTSANSPITLTSSNSIVLISASGGAVSVTVPSASANSGQLYRIKRTDSTIANVITINRTGGDVFQDGGSTVSSTTLNTQGEEVELVSDGSSTWQIMHRRIPSIWATLSFTPSSSAFGTVSNNNFKARRVGDSLEVVGYWTCGTVSTGGALITMPTNYSIDTSKILPSVGAGNNTQVGFWYRLGSGIFDNGTGVEFGPVFMISGDSTEVRFGFHATGQTDFTNDTGSGIFSNSDSVSVRYTVPISGWNG